MAKNYPEVGVSKHGTVRIPKNLVAAIEEFLKTDQAKKMGFLHITDIATEAVREFLKERGQYETKPVLEHFNLNAQGVLILDRSLESPKGRLVQVYFKEQKIFCEIDGQEPCRHKDFALELPEVQEILKKKGWKPK